MKCPKLIHSLFLTSLFIFFGSICKAAFVIQKDSSIQMYRYDEFHKKIDVGENLKIWIENEHGRKMIMGEFEGISKDSLFLDDKAVSRDNLYALQLNRPLANGIGSILQIIGLGVGGLTFVGILASFIDGSDFALLGLLILALVAIPSILVFLMGSIIKKKKYKVKSDKWSIK